MWKCGRTDPGEVHGLHVKSREESKIGVGLWLVVAKTLVIADMAPG